MNEFENKKILIIEDHQDMMMILRRNLAEHGFQTTSAENAEIGLDLFHREQPDLILLDIMLPGMSGLEALEKIKMEFTPEEYVPVIIITAKSEVEDIVTGLDSGADDYIVKPFNFDELTARIKTALRLKHFNELLVKQTNQLEEANNQIKDLNESLTDKNKELRRNVFNLHALFEVSIELNSILELDRLINTTLLTMVGQFSCKSALFFFSPRKNVSRLEVINNKGFYQEEVENLRLEKSDPMFRFFNEKKEPVLVEQLANAVENSKAIKILQATQMQIITPVRIQGVIEGLICLGPRVKGQAYSKTELEHITTLGNIISIAVNNAALYQQVEELSYTDGMTDLHNYRYFELRLNEEVIRHKRNNTGLSLLILDVDYFKNYNDQMGHPAGDEVLRKLAHILKETVRENDIVARYGGEEFAIILPAVSKNGASILAERIRVKIEQTYFDHEEIQPEGKVTISIGGASLPEDAAVASDLIHKADTALYQAKRNGRNQVKVFQPQMVH